MKIITFGYKNIHPKKIKADLIIDLRNWPNPYLHFKDVNGTDIGVQDWLKEHCEEQVDQLISMVGFMLYLKRTWKEGFTLALGCTGGQHRSVGAAEILKKSWLKIIIVENL